MTYYRRSVLFAAGILLVVVLPRNAGSASIESARRDISHLRYEQASEELVAIANQTHGEERQEALYLLAGLKSEVSEAQMIYEEVVALGPSSDWGEKSQVELAKIQYAIGDYGKAYTILEESSACRSSEEACYFQGLSAVMLDRYDDARKSLESVRRGGYGTWAFLALAEIDMKSNEPAEACRKYRSISRSGVSPTAMYRFGVCLENNGDAAGATELLEEIVRNFRNTPEAVLAREKLDLMKSAAAGPVLVPVEPPEQKPLQSGFTLQFGAFHDRTNAIKLAAELKPMLPGVRIDSNLLDYKEVHRVRFGYFATRAEAQQKANEIQQQTNETVTIMTLP
jgi:outer membrane protein assembly factor BamD (BamD/ComL family)